LKGNLCDLARIHVSQKKSVTLCSLQREICSIFDKDVSPNVAYKTSKEMELHAALLETTKDGKELEKLLDF